MLTATNDWKETKLTNEWVRISYQTGAFKPLKSIDAQIHHWLDER